jgi:predicted CXXCH cytochrome family protein
VAVPHVLEGRGDCLMCHAADAFAPFPSDHRARGNDLCALCHSGAQ